MVGGGNGTEGLIGTAAVTYGRMDFGKNGSLPSAGPRLGRRIGSHRQRDQPEQAEHRRTAREHEPATFVEAHLTVHEGFDLMRVTISILNVSISCSPEPAVGTSS